MIPLGFAAPALGLLKRVPRWVWILAAGALLVLVGMWWHSGKKEAFGNKRYNAGYSTAKDEISKLQRQLDAANAKIAADLRSKHNEEIRRIGADADAVRVRGPGKATCSGATFLPGGSGRHDAAGGPGDAAVDPVPNGTGIDLIAMPFAPTVDFGEQHDAFRTEALSWREWHRRFTAEWEAYKAKSESR